MGPIESLADVQNALGMWLLSEKSLTSSEVQKMVKAARELALYVECNLKLRELTERGFEISYFSPQLRNEIRVVLDTMDTITAGSETTLKRRNETMKAGK